MPNPTYVFEVMWDGASWTDETSRLRSCEFSRGRDYASQLTGRASSGRFTGRLNNTDGRFSPFNTSSPLTGEVVPAKKLRIRTTAPSATTRWQGFVEDIDLDPRDAKSYPKVTLKGSGPLKYIAEKKASTLPSNNVLTGTAVGLVLDDAGWPAPDRTIDAGQVQMNRWWADGDKALSHLRELEETEFGYIGESADAKIVYEDVHHRLKGVHLTSQATFRDDGGAGLKFQSLKPLSPWRDIFNIFEAIVQLYSDQALAVLWSLTGEVPSINSGVTKDFWASYPNPDSVQQAFGVNAWTTPVSTTDFLANTQADGLGLDLTASITVSATKLGNSMKIRLTNGSAETVYITFLQARGTAIWANDPIKVVVEDSASQALYGKRTYPLPGKFYPSTARAQSFCEYGISRYKDPHPILSLTYCANDSTPHLNAALALDVSDRITVIANNTALPGTQLGINRDFFIESVSFKIDRGSKTYVTYELSEADNEGGYWILGTSLLGIGTRLAP